MEVKKDCIVQHRSGLFTRRSSSESDSGVSERKSKKKVKKSENIDNFMGFFLGVLN